MKLNILSAVLVVAITVWYSQSSGAQDTQYAQGLILEYYVMQNPEDVEGPKGRLMATLLDTSAPQLTYLVPFEIEPALEQFWDKLWGLHWSGFLKVENAGPHSFNLLINISEREIKCQSWLKIQERVVAFHDLTTFRKGNTNAFGDISLRRGMYKFEVWFACNSFSYGTIKDRRPAITINMRGPNDAMLKPIPKSQLLHEL